LSARAGSIDFMSALRASLLLLALVVAGCGQSKKPPTAPVPVAESAVQDPDHKLYEQVRSGQYQLGSAQDDLQGVIELATKVSKSAGGTASHGFKDLLTKLNSAGQKLGDYTDETPSFEEFKKDISGQDERRLNAIQAGNDTLGEISDAQDILENLMVGAPADVKADLQKIQDGLDDSVDAVQAGIVALGGKVDEDDDVTPGSPGATTGS